MSKQIFQKFDVEFRKKVFVPTPETDNEAVNKAYVDSLAPIDLENKAEIDGSNTTGGIWKIDELFSTAIGSYSAVYSLDSAVVNITNNDVLGTSPGVILMKGGSPIAIEENINPDWDGYIYRAGIPKPGYPGNQQNGNYLIESKHRFRLHTITAPDSTSGTLGLLTVQPFNAIEHNYFRVVISSVDSLDITIEEPYYDEITGFNIERNAIGQKCTVAVSGDLTGVRFTSVAGADFTSYWNNGVFEFYWTGTDWMFGGYSPIEP